MLKIFCAVVLANSIYGGAANARGGGPAESMPETNFTDLPDYRPKPLAPHMAIKHPRKPVHSHHDLSHN